MESMDKAIAPEILLQPGDKVYSVYQAGICYTDQDYLMSNEVDYLYDLVKTIYTLHDHIDNVIAIFYFLIKKFDK